MPGPVSDSFDPEFGTRSRAHEIIEELDRIYGYVTNFLRRKPPIYILDLIDADLPKQVDAPPLTEKDWRLIRFAIERAKDSI